MDFQFSLDSIFPEDLMLIGRDLTPKFVDGSLNSSTPSDYYQRNFCKLDPSSRMALGEVLDRMGSASARAQGLSQVITTMEKLRTSENHIVYIITRKDADRTIDGADICVGFLKVGRKRLFILDSSGGQNEVLPVSVLDFYVHESLQRHGYGRQLFDAMLKTERVEPVHLAIDRPSDKLTSFLAKHYDLRQPCPQMNNFVVYPGFFSDRDGDVMFSVRSALAVSSWRAGGRRSSGTSLEPVTVSPCPVVRSFGRRGRRRLVTSCPLPADPRLTRAAAQGVSSLPLPTLSSPSVSSPARPSSVRPGSGCTRPAPLLPDGADYPLGEILSREGSAATRLPPWSVTHPDLWLGRREPPSVSDQTLPPWSVAHPDLWPGRREPPSVPDQTPSVSNQTPSLSDQTPSVSDQTLPARDCTVLRPSAEQPAVGHGYLGSPAAEPCPVQLPKKTCVILQPGGRLPCVATQETDTVSRAEAMHPVRSPHRMGRTFNSDGLRTVLSPRKACTLPQSDGPFASSLLMKTGALLHPEGSFPGDKLHAPSPQKSGTLPHPEGWCAGGEVPISPHLPTSRCRRSSVRLPACGPPVLPACGPPAAPPVAGPTSASYPYPWLVSKDELFYPNKRQSPPKNGYEVTSMVGVNGSPVFSRHSHDDSAAGPCRAGSRQVRNLHDHHQLW